MPRWTPDAALRLQRAAGELFSERGYGSTTVSDIAERAGLTTRTFFCHFADKRDVLFLRERELPTVIKNLLNSAPTDLDAMSLAMHGFETVATGELEHWRADIAMRQSVIDSEPQLRERERLKSANLADAIRDALVNAGIAPGDARLTAAVASSLFDAALRLWLDGPENLHLIDALRREHSRLIDLITGADRYSSPR